MPSKAADASALEPGAAAASELPYEPSVPCARCARGVDPLRAACVSAYDEGLHYFCSRACSDAHREAEARHAERVAQGAARSATATVSSRAPVDAVARRVEPSPSSTPLWPLLATALALGLGYLPFAGAPRIAALLLVGVAALFASQTSRTRRDGGVVSWLEAPLGIALLALASLLEERPMLLLAAGLGSALMWTQERALERAHSTLAAKREELAARLGAHVRVLVPGTSERVERPVTALRSGDELDVETAQVVPADALVLAGEAEVLPYPDAREALPRRPGDALLAGALVASGSLRLRALRVGDDRTLFRALDDSDSGPGLTRVLAWAAAARLTWVAAASLVPAAIIALVSAERAAEALANFATALLALPTLLAARGAHMPWRSAQRWAAARGLCFRDFLALDKASRIDTVALRVEGALVPRTYTLVELCPLSTSHTPQALLQLALSAESAAAEHGIARAIRAYAEPLGVRPTALRRLAYTKGRGITALTDGDGGLVLGNREALLSAGVSVAVADREAQRAEVAGRRVVFLALGGHVRALLVFEQSVRPEARVAMQSLFDLGLEVELVSGDHRGTVEAIARPLDVLHVKAELSAAQRAAEIKRLRDGDARVAAMGLLPNDEALLGAAELALCLDAAQLAGERELTSASRDLRDGAAAFAIARAARRRGRTVLVASAMGVLTSLLGATGWLQPVMVIALALCRDFFVLSRDVGGSDPAAVPKAK